MPNPSFPLKFLLATASIATAIGGGYFVGVRQENTNAMAHTMRLYAFAHLPGHRKEIQILSQLATMDEREFLTSRQELLCKLIKAKAALVADVYQSQVELDRISPPRRNEATIAKTIALEAADAERAFTGSACAPPGPARPSE